MRKILRSITTLYGASPLHLIALTACFALAGYILVELSTDPTFPVILTWFIGAFIAHDLILFPLYALADRSLTGSLGAIRRKRRRSPPFSAVNYIRMPVLASGLLFLLFFPGIIGQGADTYIAATGQTQQPFLGRWLLATAFLFAFSALMYAARCGSTWARKRTRAAKADRSPSSTKQVIDQEREDGLSE